MEQNKQSAVQQVYEEIKKEIIEKQYLPGEHLVEAELIEKTKYSRITVREALHRLEDAGLVKHVPNKGVVVRKITQKEQLDIFYVLMALETLAVEQATEKCTEEQLLKLETINSEIKTLLETSDYLGVGLASIRFRVAIAEITENPILIKLIEEYYYITYINTINDTLYLAPINPGIQATMLTLNRDIIAAMKENNAAKASAIIRDHLTESVEIVEKNQYS